MKGLQGGRAVLALLGGMGMLAVIGVSVAGLAARTPDAPKVDEPSPKLAPKPKSQGPKAPATPPANGAFAVKRVLKIDGPFRHGDYVWDAEGVPSGPVVVTVDLKAQTISVFRDGYEIGAAVILYGAYDKETPLGTFPILAKYAEHVSSIYGVEMPYTMRLTNDGVAIHGSDVELGNATRGCIGVPIAFARLMFAQVKAGDPVVITNGRMMAVSGVPTT